MGRSVQQTEDYLAKVATSQNMDDLSGMATEIATYVWMRFGALLDDSE
jgi:hypothetical protein